VLGPADVHVARALGRICDVTDEAVLLGAALAVRATDRSSVCVDLARVAATVAVDADAPVDIGALPWPELGPWLHALARSPVVAAGVDGPDDRPLRLAGTRLYLDRYWRDERYLARTLHGLAGSPSAGVDREVLARGLDRLFTGEAPDDQRLAAATAVLRRLTVVAGGPGTGKTTTVARILALLDEQAAAQGLPPPVVALAAPTAKAAMRLGEAVHAEAAVMDAGEATRRRLLALEGSTIHRLLGKAGGTRFRHDRHNRLPHDIVVVDETSMVALAVMARLLEALGTQTRLVLLGDPEQLVSVEAGAVLADIVGPAGEGLRMRPRARDELAAVAGQEVPAREAPPDVAIGDGIVLLRTVHRFGADIRDLAEATRAGDAPAAAEVLRRPSRAVHWIEVETETAGDDALAPVRELVGDTGRRLVAAAREGDGEAALQALGGCRLLCAHRRGPAGVGTWTARVEAWLAEAIDGFVPRPTWYVGRPVMVTSNDYGLRLFNGDTGVVVASEDEQPAVVFERPGRLLRMPPSRLGAVETVHAMTVHKSQGSQFSTVVVLLPRPDSRILTRELLYTAVTRTRERLVVVGTENSLTAAIERPVARASGLREALWEDATTDWTSRARRNLAGREGI
jgi:exodeoxyribonuclease V alpha subunit